MIYRAGQDDLASGISDGRNNSRIKDDNNSQKLSSSDIEAMRTEGKVSSRKADLHSRPALQRHGLITEVGLSVQGGDEIVNALVANSSTFTVKTEFSQEKYKAKKAKKYNPYCMVLCPTAATVCEVGAEELHCFFLLFCEG